MRPLRSSPIHSLALALLFLLITILAATDSRARLRSNPSWVVGFPSRNQEYHVGYHQRQRRHSLLDTCRPLYIDRESPPRSQLCDHLEMIRHHHQPYAPPPPPPSPRSTKTSDSEIDPRYGVEKRLVPSGPNPLHN